MKNIKVNILEHALGVLGLVAIVFMASCSQEFELPDTGSIPDNTLPEANFSFVRSGNTLADFKIISFTNSSAEATKYAWDFGVGVVCDTATVNGVLTIVCGDETTSTDKDVPLVKFSDGEGTYPVTLVASDANDSEDVLTLDVEVVDEFVAINPVVNNGDMESKPFSTDWGMAAYTGVSSTTPNTSSDGSPIDYDGIDTGSKTGGMKFTSGTSNPANQGSRRYAYQALTVSPTTADRTVKYIVEYQYAIKVAASAGSKIIVEILDGHFDDAADAIASTPLTQSTGTELLGKGVFETVKQEFTSNASGEIAIFLSSETDQDAYIDNVKVYPKP